MFQQRTREAPTAAAQAALRLRLRRARSGAARETMAAAAARAATRAPAQAQAPRRVRLEARAAAAGEYICLFMSLILVDNLSPRTRAHPERFHYTISYDCFSGGASGSGALPNKRRKQVFLFLLESYD